MSISTACHRALSLLPAGRLSSAELDDAMIAHAQKEIDATLKPDCHKRDLCADERNANRVCRLLFLVLLLLSPAARADDQALTGILPAEAQIIETRDISPIAKKSRVLVLWMTNAQKHDCAEDKNGQVPVDDPACMGSSPPSLYEHFWKGRTNLSLVDANARRIVNTICGSGVDSAVKFEATLRSMLRAAIRQNPGTTTFSYDQHLRRFVPDEWS